MSNKYIAVYLHKKPFFGHQVTAVPFMHYIREFYPDHKTIIVAPKKSSFVLKALGFIDELYEYDPSRKLSGLFGIMRQLRKKDLTATYIHRRSSVDTTLTAWFATNSKNLIGFDDPSIRLFLKEKHEFIKQRYVGVNYIHLVGKTLSDFAENSEKNMTDRVVIIPGGNDDYKKYPLEKYIRIGEKLSQSNPVHFVLGSDMTEEIEGLKDFRNRFTLHIGEPIPDVEDTIKNAALVIANDCGPSHFAHIYDTPRISLFAGTHPVTEWFYGTENAVLLRSEDVNDISTIQETEIIENATRILKM